MKRTNIWPALTLLAATFTYLIPTAMADGPGWTVKSTVIRLVNTSEWRCERAAVA